MPKGGEGHFEEFQEHTRLKHQILSAYLESWARKLLIGGKPGGRVWFVDGFAGAGQDSHGSPGSPLIAARLAKLLLDERGAVRGRAPMVVLAIESDHSRHEQLKKLLKPYRDSKPTLARTTTGTLQEYLGAIVDKAANDPILYFLDPFGVKGLVVNQLPILLSGPQNEVFVLFSHMGARRLHATLLSEGLDVENEVDQIKAAPSLFPDFDQEAIESLRDQERRSQEALRATQLSAEKILGEALGPQAIEEASAAPPEDRPAVLTRIFMDRLRAAGATHVVALPVRNATNAPIYQLVYATKSPIGLRTMKEAMHTGLNSSDLPEEARDAIRQELGRPIGEVVEDLLRYFGGREVPWLGEAGGESVKRHLLEQTLVFPWQFGPVKAALARYRQKGRKIVYEFPVMES